MKIERVVSAFQPITITLETQIDVNLLFNIAMIASESSECNDEEQAFCEQIGATLDPHVTVDEARSGAEEQAQ